MTDGDLDNMAQLLGDREVMRYYPKPKPRAEAQGWIDWNRNNYASYGHGLWLLETRGDTTFVGDCGLTWQEVDGKPVLEIGYHVTPAHQGKGLATEAAKACLNYAFKTLGADYVTSIINPENRASRRVAEHVGMTVETHTRHKSGVPVVVYSIRRE